MGGLGRRARRLEEAAELQERRKRLEAERVLQEALKRVSTAELEAMREHFERVGPEDWIEEDAPLMRRLMALMEEVRQEEAEGFAWRAEMDERKELERGE